VTSNDSVRLTRNIISPFTRKLSGKDVSLPKIIRQLHPDFILVRSNSVSISVPPDRTGGFAVLWAPDERQTNLWRLEVGIEGEASTLYQETKP
jgi:hypothetical protein